MVKTIRDNEEQDENRNVRARQEDAKVDDTPGTAGAKDVPKDDASAQEDDEDNDKDCFDNFDYDKEDKVITDMWLRDLAKHIPDPTQADNARAALIQKAIKYQYHYDDSKTFDLALELYNRQRCVPSRIQGEHVANTLYQRKPVAGNHRKPCSECDAPFRCGMDYVQECASGPYYAKKLCVGCMGRRLKKAVGTDTQAIQAALAPLRVTQQRGISTGYFAQAYMR